MIFNHFGFNTQRTTTSVTVPTPVAFLDAGSLSSYPGSGSIWYDLVGTNNVNFSASNAPPYVAFTNAGAASFFSSLNQTYFATGSQTNTLPVSNGSWSVGIWVRVGTYLTQQWGIMGWNGVIMKADNNTGLNPDGGNIIETRGYGLDRPPAIPTNPSSSFAYVAFTQNVGGGNLKRAYYNGNQTASASVTGTVLDAVSPLTIMQAGQGFTGSIAMVKIWAIALTPAQVTTEFNTYRSRYGL